MYLAGGWDAEPDYFSDQMVTKSARRSPWLGSKVVLELLGAEFYFPRCCLRLTEPMLQGSEAGFQRTTILICICTNRRVTNRKLLLFKQTAFRRTNSYISS